ncbi:hypothetical protein B0H12DRAFT_1139895 [Mycena haematopus]|nr:hypothetical protein B0H12DRAFT_1139895 [Mycena haematopus]
MQTTWYWRTLQCFILCDLERLSISLCLCLAGSIVLVFLLLVFLRRLGGVSRWTMSETCRTLSGLSFPPCLPDIARNG